MTEKSIICEVPFCDHKAHSQQCSFCNKHTCFEHVQHVAVSYLVRGTWVTLNKNVCTMCRRNPNFKCKAFLNFVQVLDVFKKKEREIKEGIENAIIEYRSEC